MDSLEGSVVPALFQVLGLTVPLRLQPLLIIIGQNFLGALILHINAFLQGYFLKLIISFREFHFGGSQSLLYLICFGDTVGAFGAVTFFEAAAECEKLALLGGDGSGAVAGEH